MDDIISGCHNHSKIDKLEMQMEILVENTNKMDDVLKSLGDAMTIMARKEVTVEQHTKELVLLHGRVSQNEKDIRDFTVYIHGKCEIKDKQIQKTKYDLEEKIDTHVSELYKSDWSLVWKGLAGLFLLGSVIFAYIHISKAEHMVSSDKISKTLDSMGETISKIDKTVSNIVLTQSFIKERLAEEAKHNHGSKN